MLSDAEKELIRAQEIYRGEVRRELEKLEPPRSRAARLFAFFNCSLGMFLLSTVFVSVFTWVYGEVSSSRAKQTTTEETAQKLRLEIVHRLDTIQKLEGRFRSEHHSVIRSAIFGFRPHANVNPSWKRFYSPMFPEYGERSLVSLLWQLEALSKPEERSKITDLRHKASLFEDYFDRLQYIEEPSNGRTPDNMPLEFFFLSQEDSQRLRQEVLGPFESLRVSL
ncbi:MAG TPA: hypothetical protein VF179_31125 [Thermoanaerobaculia bacterium]|nr:hypothetical protein [Thermoanaerobaculia bacterium]